MENQLHILTGAYALNAVDPEERLAFERHALDSPYTLGEVRSLSATAAMLARGTTPVAPPQRVKDNIMAAIRNTPQLPASETAHDSAPAVPGSSAAPGSAAGTVPSTAPASAAVPGSASAPDIAAGTGPAAGGTGRRAAGNGGVRDIREAPGARGRFGTRTVAALAAAAAVLLIAAVGLGAAVISQHNDLRQLDQRIDAMGASQESMQRIVSAPDVKSATQRMDDGAAVTVIYSRSAGAAALTASGLPQLPEGKGYELWLIGAGGAVPAGMLEAGAQAPALIQGPLDNATHIGITVEPAGGSPQPTTDPIMLQQL